ncbi:unnamed protein product [Arabis nemorensis]|uniref:Uncharacterized protein n=1 Tax=Arabis nemorensis TaxID=586526 RepID=A0A565ATG0_9BRAS|nr:unnamed protein product [Arabis nemorensis]
MVVRTTETGREISISIRAPVEYESTDLRELFEKSRSFKCRRRSSGGRSSSDGVGTSFFCTVILRLLESLA